MKHIFFQQGAVAEKQTLELVAQQVTCENCKVEMLEELMRSQMSICPFCGGYFRMRAADRIELLADEGSFHQTDKGLLPKDELGFPGYRDKLAKYKKLTGINEAVVTGTVKIGGMDAALGVMDSYFMMGSMGAAVGQKLVNITELATKERLPLIIVCASGGARMQEGMLSLVQMSRCSMAISRHNEAGLLYVSVLTNPTTGGVTASFAMQGDIILAEPGALVGFAGPRVIEQTVGEKLPEDFQRAEYLLKHGIIDAIAKREEMRNRLSQILKLHMPYKGGKTCR